ncbi:MULTISPECIES: cysteine-rich CWC family protein [Shewanella]|uniref:cysteine-rich CWC family protein n=1 Tax=Shewanella TaxID=22 RepID=UPI001BC0C0E6|nr:MULTISPECIES: cysteine-rich CWC family protein [Shewanella]GIU50021.1 hypothetical protein TUM4249_09250 [Shewanella sp. KT0246]
MAQVPPVQVFQPNDKAVDLKEVSESLICPICFKQNQCAVTAGLSIESCWCLTQSAEKKVDPKLLSDLSGKACVCQDCYKKLTQ